MKASQILRQFDHRPFEYPKGTWRFYQEWNKAVFMHWEVEPEELEPLIPKALELDLLNDKAWISLVAFDMNHIGVRMLPKVPHISDFHEINIRTYATYKGKPSVYFLSMEASKKSSCKVLKTLSKFPYEYARMNRNDFSFESHNKKANNTFELIYRLPSEPFQKDETDRWLTERYAAFQDYKSKIIEYDMHHLEWPVQPLVVKDLTIDYPKFNGLINEQPQRAYYSQGVKVLTWNKRKYQL